MVLSDVLPYEVPAQYSNRHFYKFLADNAVRLEGTEVSWRSNSNKTRTVELVLKLIFGIAPNAAIKRHPNGRRSFASVDDNTIPFSFRVAKSENDYRTLSIPHPRSQIRVSAFYRDEYAALLYFAGKSPFSLRKPVRVGKYSFAEDQLHSQLRATWAAGVSENSQEYETFKSYFAYERYSNIYKFYESPEYQAMEKRYKHLLRLDISKCFESIYTHSISWAVYGKELVKDNYSRKSRTFPERFDELMQKLNYNETNGILVGSEFARLFAEIILQAVDGAVLRQLEKLGLRRGRHFEIVRYVDDYFVFFDRLGDESRIKGTITEQLKIYGLSLNGEKELRGANPDITPISIAKSRISRLLEERIGSAAVASTAGRPGLISGGKSSTALITDYKTIIKETSAPEKDVLNYTLSILERRIVEALKEFSSLKTTDGDEEDLAAAIAALVEFAFFIYSASPKVNPTVKLCRIVVNVSQFAINKPFRGSQRSRILDAVFFEIRSQLERSHGDEDLQVEKLYLLSALVPLGPAYLLPAEEIERMFSIDATGKTAVLQAPLNHFALTTLLHYVKRQSRYTAIRLVAEAEWIRRVKESRAHDAERVLLILDAASSPFLSQASKLTILLHAGLTARKDRFGVMRLAPAWFTRWRGFDLGLELDLKRNQEVY
ncbi:MAG: RNA-directed DNA polymerase [Salinibacterium sp.]|nr:RNA-directed DNA polymerase [Salinibacterium sp.]